MTKTADQQVDEILVEMDQKVVKSGRKCRVCNDFSTVARLLVSRGREDRIVGGVTRRHSYETIAVLLMEKFGIDINPSVLRRHMMRHVER